MALKAMESSTAVIGNVHLVYDKYEADREILKQKRKRCLAMAKACASRVVVWATEGNEKKSDWYWKWKEKWRKLAEKFKPNSTAQQGKG